jgi:hypothetical protein
MTMRRLVLGLLGVLAAALLAGCGGTGGGSALQPLTPKQLTDSAAASADANSARFTFGMQMTVPGVDDPFSFSGDGAFDAGSGRASMSIDMSSFAKLLGQAFGAFGGTVDLGDADKWKIEAVQDGLTVYMRFPLIAEKLPQGKTWVKLDVAAAAKAQGVDLDQLKQFTENDPRKTLDYLRAVAGKIVPVGREDVRGVDTTRYKATIDLLAYKDLMPAAQREKVGSAFDQAVQQLGLRYLPVDLWVDDDGLVRKMVMAMSVNAPSGSEQAEMSMTFELFDYGKAVDIELPDASEVADASTLKLTG